ncbi:MAG: hypothetical protein IH945_06265 [Armatimonadetes bacterium]|nr:hypothetical protein [Armatimonadota bacterium]
MINFLAAAVLAATLGSAPSETELTVYNQGFALVKEQRSLSLRRGVQTVSIEDVAALIETNSVGIRSLSAPGSFSVLEQNYQYDLISPNAILNKAVGRKIVFNRVLPDGSRERLEGMLLSSPTAVVGNARGGSSMVWNGMVIQTDDGRIILNPSGEIEVSSIPEGLISKPTLQWLIESAMTGVNKIELSYLTQGISWKADYVLSLDQAGTLGDLKGWVTLTNNSGATYKDAKLKLLAGEVFRQQNYPNRFVADGRPAARAAMEDSFQEEQFADYHLYTLQRRTTVRNKEIKQVSLLEGFGVPVTKKLVIDAMRMYRGRGYRPNEGVIGVGNLKALVFIEFTNDEKSNLGMPLPKGTVKVFQRDSTGSLQMLGEAGIDHTPRNEKISLPIGRAFDVVADRKRTEFKWIGSRRIGTIETFEIEVRNRKETSETVHVYERFHAEWEITSKNQPFNKLDSHTVDFVLRMRPNEVRKIVYTVETRWG